MYGKRTLRAGSDDLTGTVCSRKWGEWPSPRRCCQVGQGQDRQVGHASRTTGEFESVLIETESIEACASGTDQTSSLGSDGLKGSGRIGRSGCGCKQVLDEEGLVTCRLVRRVWRGLRVLNLDHGGTLPNRGRADCSTII